MSNSAVIDLLANWTKDIGFSQERLAVSPGKYNLIATVGSGSVAFGTEAPYFNSMQTETIVIGPGSINQAHQPNEYLPIDQIDPTVQLLKGLIQKFCID